MSSGSSQEIIRAIQDIVGIHTDDKVSLVMAEVNSVSITDRTANITTISGKESVVYDVNLQAVPSDGILVSPTIGSTVYVLSSKYTTPFIVQYSDIDQIYYTLTHIELTGKANLNGDNYGGLIKIQELVDKINTLENKVNELQTWSGTLTISTVTGDLQGAPFTPVEPITPTQKADIENTTIKHGNKEQ